MITSQSQLTNSVVSLDFETRSFGGVSIEPVMYIRPATEEDEVESVHNYAYEFVQNNIREYRDGARLLRDMSGIYPGDPEGTLALEAFLLEGMADALELFNWNEHVAEYIDTRPEVEVTYA